MYERSTVWVTTARVLQRRHAYIHVFLQLVQLEEEVLHETWF